MIANLCLGLTLGLTISGTVLAVADTSVGAWLLSAAFIAGMLTLLIEPGETR